MRTITADWLLPHGRLQGFGANEAGGSAMLAPEP